MSDADHLAQEEELPTILLVEPDFHVRIETAADLREHDYRVVEAVNGDEALRLLRSGRIVHVILSDGDACSRPKEANLVDAVEREFPHVKILQSSGRPLGEKILKRPYDAGCR